MTALRHSRLALSFVVFNLAGCAVSAAPDVPTAETYSEHVAQAETVQGVLGPNESLLRGRSMLSPGGYYRLSLQDDGNLVVARIADGFGVWASHTNGLAVSEAIMQSDGNFVLKDYAGRGVWATGTNGQVGCSLIVQDDGNLVVSSHGPRWASNTSRPPSSIVKTAPTHPDHLSPNQALFPGQALQSPNGEFFLWLQADGNLVLADGNSGIWSTQTNGYAVSAARLQGDGNFVLAGYGSYAVWKTNTQASNAVLQLQDDGNLVLYGSVAVWASAQHP
jgi:hypothetical protein